MRTIFAAIIFSAFCSFAFAQTVTVDNTNGSPDNQTTFASVMMALHSFQASGKVTASTDAGGIGKNHGNAAPNLINIIATGTPYNEIIRLDERVASGEQSIQDEDFKMVGVASGGNEKPLLQVKDDGTNDDDAFELRTNVNYEVHNIIFAFDPAYPEATANGVYLIDIDRTSASTGTPSTVLYQDCVFTGLDASGQPLASNKDEAFIDRTADLVLPAGGSPGRMVAVVPDRNEGIYVTFKDCVFYRCTDLQSTRNAMLYCYFGGTGVSADTTWTESAGLTLDGCVFAYGPGVAVECQSGGSSVNAANQYINITGQNARADGLAEGNPTVITHMGAGNTTTPTNGAGIYIVEPNATNSATGVLSGDWNNLWIYDCSGYAIYDAASGTGSAFYWNLSDALLVNNNKGGGGSSIVGGWRSVTTPHPSSVDRTNVTIIAGNALNSGVPANDLGAAFNYSGAAAYNEPTTVNMNNVLIGKSLAALNPVQAVRNAGPVNVVINDSGLLTGGGFALGSDPVTVNTGAGSVTLNNVLNADPGFFNTTNPFDKKFFAPTSSAYEQAGPGSTPIDGGRAWVAPPASASNWSIYE